MICQPHLLPARPAHACTPVCTTTCNGCGHAGCFSWPAVCGLIRTATGSKERKRHEHAAITNQQRILHADRVYHSAERRGHGGRLCVGHYHAATLRSRRAATYPPTACRGVLC